MIKSSPLVGGKVSLPVDYKKELQSFVKIIGHDLSGPIRHIKSFHKILMADFTLNEEQQELKGYVDDAIYRLESQLDGMLALSNFDISEIKLIEVDVKTLLEDVVDSLYDLTLTSTLVISVAPNIKVLTDRGRLHRACVEVLGNALKFHPANIQPDVCVVVKVEDDSVLIIVEDKGIGIADKYFNDIFQPFRCLNHQGEYSGIGMGLTLCRKALQSINSTIDVKNNDSQGCKFTISLPSHIK